MKTKRLVPIVTQQKHKNTSRDKTYIYTYIYTVYNVAQRTRSNLSS